jgi:signal peptidase II
MRRKQIALSLVVFFVNFFCDRVTKTMAVVLLAGKEPLSFLNNLVVLTYTENSGAFLSLGAGFNIYIKYILFLIIPALICVGALYYVMFIETRTYRIVIAACIAGGGIGNLMDRLLNDFRVTDFLNFGIGSLRTGILNVADISVTFGVIAFFIFELRSGSNNKAEHTRAPDGNGNRKK